MFSYPVCQLWSDEWLWPVAQWSTVRTKWYVILRRLEEYHLFCCLILKTFQRESKSQKRETKRSLHLTDVQLLLRPLLVSDRSHTRDNDWQSSKTCYAYMYCSVVDKGESFAQIPPGILQELTPLRHRRKKYFLYILINIHWHIILCKLIVQNLFPRYYFIFFPFYCFLLYCNNIIIILNSL